MVKFVGTELRFELYGFYRRDNDILSIDTLHTEIVPSHTVFHGSNRFGRAPGVNHGNKSD